MRLSGCWPLGYLNIHADILPKRKTNTGSYGSPRGGGASLPLILACIISPIPGWNYCQPHPHLCWWSLEVQLRSCQSTQSKQEARDKQLQHQNASWERALMRGVWVLGRRLAKPGVHPPRVWGGERMLSGCLASPTQGF